MDSGFVYVPYRLLAEREDTGGIKKNEVYVLHLDTTKPYNQPKLVLKLKLEQLHRNKVSYDIGYGSDACDTVPDEIKLNLPFSRHGGPYPMQGQGNEDPMETEFDFSYYFNQFFGTNPSHFGKVFLKLYQTSGYGYNTTIDAFSLVDYRWNETFELSYNDLPIEMTTENDTAIMGIEYDLLPFNIHIFSMGFDCNKICRKRCRVYDNKCLTLADGINVDFYNGTLVVEEGATLVIDDSVTLRAVRGIDSLIVYGNLQIGNDVKFLTEEGASFTIEIRNYDLSLSMENTLFDHATFSVYCDTLAADNCVFDHTNLGFYRTTDQCLILSHSKFTGSTVIASVDEMSAQDFGTVIITDCDFENSNGDAVIVIEAYKNFCLLHDTLVYDANNGINIYQSGSSVGENHYVSECKINYSGQSITDSTCGIEIYHSYVDIQNNLISDNKYGVVCLDRSNVRLLGNQYAQTADETQQIINNSHNQVFIVTGSFPYEFQWNVIYNNAMNHDTLVTYHTWLECYLPYLHVEYNYWGPVFIAEHDLHPSDQYVWSPVWTPPWINPKSTGEDEALFHGAEQAIIDDDYAGAESNFKEIIENYPESKYVQASVKELLPLKRIYDRDFTGLKNYLDTVATLQQDSVMMNLAAHVANWCNIENEDYTSAISWFESQIENPPSFEDSIFAVIDLGYTYMLMESGGSRSSSYIGRYPEYKPVSRQAYEKNRDYLIDLLFKSYTQQHQNQDLTDNDVTTFHLTQNFPNPFKESTDIIFHIPEAARVSVKVYNALGALVATPFNQNVEKGEHKFTFTPKNFSEGIYYYTLEVNDQKKDFKKMVLMK